MLKRWFGGKEFSSNCLAVGHLFKGGPRASQKAKRRINMSDDADVSCFFYWVLSGHRFRN